ncbi:MAG: tRNA lysidine(34) synthetase TilS [Acidobacteriota bacterium]
MNKTFEKVLIFIRRHSLLDSSTGVTVAVSGGPDSMALLDMLLQIRERDSAFASLRLHVAHLDHKLRPESEEDAEFVRAMARRSNLPVTISAIDVRAEVRSARRGLEETAREIRYRFLLDAARQAGCDRIATGHTMNDQTETFLMRLARGTGLRGLAAMRAVIPAHQFSEQTERGSGGVGEWENGGVRECGSVGDEEPSPPYSHTPILPYSHPTVLLIRPLLTITREEVESYCRERGLEFRVDATNTSMDYTRNRVRLSLLPALAEINPRIIEAIARAAELIATEEDALRAIVSSLLEQVRVANDSYSLAALIAQPAALRRRMIIEAIRQAGAASDRIGSKHVAAVDQLLEERQSGSRIVLPRRIEVWREFDRIVFRRRSNESEYYQYRFDSQQIEAGRLRISLKRGEDGKFFSSLIEEARREKDHRGRDWMMAVLDDDRLPRCLVVRTRRAGERVCVKKNTVAKKLKSLMIDHKIPASRRASWPVVASAEGRYVWSPGMPPDKELIADRYARRLAILRAEEY